MLRGRVVELAADICATGERYPITKACELIMEEEPGVDLVLLNQAFWLVRDACAGWDKETAEGRAARLRTLLP